jgi:hypothetical protein
VAKANNTDALASEKLISEKVEGIVLGPGLFNQRNHPQITTAGIAKLVVNLRATRIDMNTIVPR